MFPHYICFLTDPGAYLGVHPGGIPCRLLLGICKYKNFFLHDSYFCACNVLLCLIKINLMYILKHCVPLAGGQYIYIFLFVISAQWPSSSVRANLGGMMTTWAAVRFELQWLGFIGWTASPSG